MALVGFSKSYYALSRPEEPNKCNLLELGCGASANIEFFKWLGVNYFSLEGSPTMVKILHEKFPYFSKNIKVANFTKQIPFNENFDIVVDRAALTHNDTESIHRALMIIKDKMKLGSSFIGIDWFSTKYYDYQSVTKLEEDVFTYSNFKRGQFEVVGNVHFSNKEHILDLFKDFEVKILEEKVITKSIPDDGHIFASWNIFAIKK